MDEFDNLNLFLSMSFIIKKWVLEYWMVPVDNLNFFTWKQSYSASRLALFEAFL